MPSKVARLSDKNYVRSGTARTEALRAHTAAGEVAGARLDEVINLGSKQSRLCIYGIVASGLIFGLAGCASPGVPRPPSLGLPATVTDLAGIRVGDRVELHWTSPSRTTDGLDLKTPVTVEICRDPAQPQPPRPTLAEGSTEQAVPCTPVLSMGGHPGASTAIDRMPAILTAAPGPRPLVAYRVRILNASGRSAPPSAVALVPGGPAPPMLEGFRVIQQKTGVVLEWPKTVDESAPTRRTAVEVERTIQPSSNEVNAPMAKPTRPAKSPKANASDPFSKNDREDIPTNVRLRQDSRSPSSSAIDQTPSTPQAAAQHQLDGMIDRSALQNETYLYSAQRVLAVSVAEKTVEIRSEPTAPIKIVIRDTFPPQPPEGLVSFPGQTGLSAVPSHGTIDLSWVPSTEIDIAGYMVYRTDITSDKPITNKDLKPACLTSAPLPGPAYRDATVLAGHRYAYRVTAVDRNGNESGFSRPVEGQLDAR